MSFKAPVDAFDLNALNVISAPRRRPPERLVAPRHRVRDRGDLGDGALRHETAAGMVAAWPPPGWGALVWRVAALVTGLGFVVEFFGLLPPVAGAPNQVLGPLGRDVAGATAEHYRTVWVDRGFAGNFGKSLIVAAGVVTVSLTVDTLAGYGLRATGSRARAWCWRSGSRSWRWCSALPNSVLVAGWLPVFFNSAERLAPILGDKAPRSAANPGR
ncbi:MAG: hypothetical protein R3D80_20830 [Paracoccaceae bacterium]